MTDLFSARQIKKNLSAASEMNPSIQELHLQGIYFSLDYVTVALVQDILSHYSNK